MIKITNKEDCCGCSACASVCTHNAIKLRADEEGFLYPSVDTNYCIDCGLCEKVCPILQRKGKMREDTTEKLFFAVRHKNPEILINSSSGGAFSALAEYVLENKGVVYGAVYNKKMQVVHARAINKNEYALMRGSKYSQSDIYGIYSKCKEDLKRGVLVLFTGTPCQIAGLKSYLTRSYENLITVDLVCHAVPSPKVFADYVQSINKIFHDKLISINMRYKKSHGWSHSFSYCYTFRSGKEIIDPVGINNWGRIFFSGFIDRPSCHECKFTNFDRTGDITIADFWDDLFLRPDIKSKNGTSLFIVNSENGKNLLEKLTNKMYFWEVTKYESLQRCLIKPSDASPKRNEFWNYYLKNGFEKTCQRYFFISRKSIIVQSVKIFVKKIFK